MGRILKFDGMQIDTDEIISDDMPNEIMKEIYEICGKDTALSLLEYQRGVVIQVPTRAFDKLKKRMVGEFYDGTTASIRRICRKFNISDTRVREILKEQRVKTPDENQLSLLPEFN